MKNKLFALIIAWASASMAIFFAAAIGEILVGLSLPTTMAWLVLIAIWGILFAWVVTGYPKSSLGAIVTCYGFGLWGSYVIVGSWLPLIILGLTAMLYGVTSKM